MRPTGEVNHTHGNPWDALLLCRRRAANFDRCQQPELVPAVSKAGQIRALLRNGPMNAAAICMEVEIASSGLVGAVLKHDLAIGRVKFFDGRYELAKDYDQKLQQSIRQARALLESNGYQVVQP
jgi:hypothetical protein